MTMNEALEIINQVETYLLLKSWPNTETLELILGLLHKLGSAPGPPDIITSRLLSLEKWIRYLSGRYETYEGRDAIKGTILAESRLLKYIICHAADELKS